MFEFTNVIPLFGLCSISIIILIHLRGKKRKKVYFSTLSFFEARRTVVSRKSIHLLILLLQIAIAAFVIMSLAKPRLSTETDEIALVLDLSNSIGTQEENGTRFDLLKEEAISIIENTDAKQINLVVFADDTWFIANATNKTEIISELEKLSVIGGKSDVDSALKATVDLLGDEITIYLITDGTYANIYSSLNYVNNKKSKVIAKLVGKQNGSTIAITDITIPDNVRINNEFSISVKVLNYLDQYEEVDITIELDNTNISQRTVTLSSKKYKDVTFDNLTVTENVDHLLKVYLETSSNDVIYSDNIRYRVIPSTEIIGKVLYIENLLGQSLYVESALEVNPYVSVETFGSLDSTLAEKLEEYDLVILSDLAFSDINSYSTQLINYVANGSCLFIASGSNIEQYSAIENLLPFVFGNITSITNEDIETSGNVFQDVDLTHVAFSKIIDVSSTNQDIEYIANITHNSTSYPLFFKLSLGQGKIYFYTSTITFGSDDFDATWTDWPKKYSYPIFWQNLLEIALQGKSPTTAQKDFFAGETLIFDDQSGYIITLPNNDTITGAIVFSDMYLPGFYQVNISNQSYHISVNGEVNEFNAAPVSDTVADANGFFENDKKLTQKYTNLWWDFTLFGLIAMLIEWNVNWRV